MPNQQSTSLTTYAQAIEDRVGHLNATDLGGEVLNLTRLVKLLAATIDQLQEDKAALRAEGRRIADLAMKLRPEFSGVDSGDHETVHAALAAQSSLIYALASAIEKG